MEPDPLASLKRKSNIIKRLLNTTDGLAMVELLEEEFDREELRGTTNEETHFNLGARSVLVYLRQLYEVKFDN